MTTRAADPVDGAAIRALFAEGAAHDGLASIHVRRVLDGDLARPTDAYTHGRLIVSDEAHALVGMVAVAEDGEIRRLMVRPSHRGRGYGRALLTAALRAGGTWLDCMADNRAARNLYQYYMCNVGSRVFTSRRTGKAYTLVRYTYVP